MFYIDRETNGIMDEPAEAFILYCKHSDMGNITGDMTSHICCAINKIVPGPALGTQKIRGIWIIAVHTPQARTSLLQSTITVNQKKAKLQDNNPYDLKAKHVEGERVVFKDLPLWESDTQIKDYLKSLEQVG